MGGASCNEWCGVCGVCGSVGRCSRVPEGARGQGRVRIVAAVDRGDGVGLNPEVWPSGSGLGDSNALQVHQSGAQVLHIEAESTEPRDAGFKHTRCAGCTPQDRAGGLLAGWRAGVGATPRTRAATRYSGNWQSSAVSVLEPMM